MEVNGGAGRASRLADRRSASLPGTRAAGTGPVTGIRLFPRRALLGRPPAPRIRRYPDRQRERRRRRMAAGGQCPFMRAITERDWHHRPGGMGSVPDPCRFGTIGNSVGETPGRVQIAWFWCGRIARL